MYRFQLADQKLLVGLDVEQKQDHNTWMVEYKWTAKTAQDKEREFFNGI